MRGAYPVALCALWWNCQISVLTYHNDLSRTGQNLHETLLTPASVSSGQFGQLFSYPVDGQVYAQPLYVPGVIVPGKGIHNIVFVATEHDSVYAFDADNHLSDPLWHVSFLNPGAGVNAASAADVVCDSITPEIGVTATPVIDPVSGTLYVVAMTEQLPNGNFAQWLHALDIATGAEKSGSPVQIQASVPGAADGNTTVVFQPWLTKERAGLLLLNGTVYTSWSSQCDSGNYHGWIIGYNAASLQQSAVFIDTPNWEAGSFWQGGAAPSADAAGNIYAVAANGTFDADLGGSDYGESVLKLSTGQGLSVGDYFAPYNTDALTDDNLDLGSSGALLLPDEVGSAAHPHLLVLGSKSGAVYVLDRDNLGHFLPNSNTEIVQSLAGAVAPLFGIPAYFHNTIYFSGANDVVKAFPIQNGLMASAPSSAGSAQFGTLGTVPSISANGAANGILWTIDPTGALDAYDAADLSHQLFQGSAGQFVKFSTPTIANGRVYVGTGSTLAVFGITNQPYAAVESVSSAASQSGPVAPGATIHLFGVNLAPRITQASSAPWPRSLEGTSVFVNGVAAQLLSVSPTQINALVPVQTKPGEATVNVINGSRVLPPIDLRVR